MSAVAGSLANGTVLIAGASSPSGVACARAVVAAGASIVAVDINMERLATAMEGLDGVRMEQCDLTNSEAVAALHTSLEDDGCRIDGVIHLVGGWRGGKGITGQTDEDWDFLHRLIVTTLRNVTRKFYDDVASSPIGRYAIVSATAVSAPTAGGASYTAAKAAAETWIMAMAQGLTRAQSKRKNDPIEQHSAASVIVIKALLDDSMIAAEPEKSFTGYTHVNQVAEAMVDVFTASASEVNGARIVLAS
ncbi:SDR family NAD(P)-dependent oxidoreductase [Arthrobacter roseus]|uniref:SDR family NAD(P)-dependent oxidoreductase n=1 Tax=Arthrobacter roseus TaxID=136274 RepID=UPI001962F5B0|nr:SDR family NAD(P)-dependent oxidoreductase [Arthrobacter roseus]MBM7848402.1 NADP-dependent 3-hydroxy acid dehydrogenase YdfG [Arthrobacter roseus]